MAASSRAQVLRLYRALLRESQRFTAYGYRTYAIRRIRDAFRENKHLKDSEEIQTLVNKARTNLEIIHRQTPWHWDHGACSDHRGNYEGCKQRAHYTGIYAEPEPAKAKPGREVTAAQ
ncbi:LYR motif-containing protein 4 isoform 2-T2 [Pangshura tecta]